MADNSNTADLTRVLTTIQNSVAAVNNLAQMLSQATVSSSSLRVQIAGVSTTSGSTTSGTVTQVNTGSGLTGGPITTTGTISLLSSVGTVSLTTLTNSISSDVALSNTANFFDGPSVAQGTSGVWLAVGNVGVTDTAGAANIIAKMWDGTTVVDAGSLFMSLANVHGTISLSGILTNPSSNIKISCKDITSVSGLITSNFSGTSKDSTLTAVRIG